MYNIPLGIALTLVGNTLISISFTLIKRAHVAAPANPYKQRQWWAGMLLMIPGELGNLAAFGFAPVVLVSPLGSIGIVVTALLAQRYLNERFSRIGYLGIAHTIVGVSLVTASMPMTEGVDTLVLLQRNFSGPFCIYFGVLVSGALFASAYRNLLAVVYVLGVYGMTCSLACRAVASLVTKYASSPLFYAALAVAGVTIGLQCVAFQTALNKHPLVKVVPAHFGLMQAMLSVGAGLLFEDLRYTLLGMFVPGMVLTVVGCTLVCKARNEPALFKRLRDVTTEL